MPFFGGFLTPQKGILVIGIVKDFFSIKFVKYVVGVVCRILAFMISVSRIIRATSATMFYLFLMLNRMIAKARVT